MEALLWLASAAPVAGLTTIDQLLDRILGLERAHWQKLLGMQDANAIRDLTRGIGQVTLLQGVSSRSAAEQLLMADSFYGESARPVRTSNLLSTLYIDCMAIPMGSPRSSRTLSASTTLPPTRSATQSL